MSSCPICSSLIKTLKDRIKQKILDTEGQPAWEDQEYWAWMEALGILIEEAAKAGIKI